MLFHFCGRLNAERNRTMFIPVFGTFAVFAIKRSLPESSDLVSLFFASYLQVGLNIGVSVFSLLTPEVGGYHHSLCARLENLLVRRSGNPTTSKTDTDVLKTGGTKTRLTDKFI